MVFFSVSVASWLYLHARTYLMCAADQTIELGVWGKRKKREEEGNGREEDTLHGSLSDFEWWAFEVGFNGGVVPWANIQLRIDRFGADLEIGIAQGAADRVDTNVIARLQEVDVGQFALPGWIQLGPLGVAVAWKQVRWILQCGVGAGAWHPSGNAGVHTRGRSEDFVAVWIRRTNGHAAAAAAAGSTTVFVLGLHAAVRFCAGDSLGA